MNLLDRSLQWSRKFVDQNLELCLLTSKICDFLLSKWPSKSTISIIVFCLLVLALHPVVLKATPGQCSRCHCHPHCQHAEEITHWSCSVITASMLRRNQAVQEIEPGPTMWNSCIQSFEPSLTYFNYSRKSLKFILKENFILRKIVGSKKYRWKFKSFKFQNIIKG